MSRVPAPPSPSPPPLARFAQLVRDRRFGEAIELGRGLVAHQPDLAPAWQLVGACARSLGRPAEALAAFEMACRLQPEDPAAHSNLGIACRDAGQTERAERHYREALRLAPAAADAHNNLAIVLHGQKRLDEAAASFRAALAHAPGHAAAHGNLGNALKALGRLDEACASMQQALQLQPGFAKAHSNLGNVLAEQGRLAEAEACYRRAVALEPGYAEAWSHLADCLAQQGRSGDAQACYREALRLRPALLEALNNLGHLYNELGRLDEAEASFRSALAHAPDFLPAHSNLLFCLNYQPEIGPQALREAYRAFEHRLQARVVPVLPPPAWPRTAGRRLRIGYVSPDFRLHSCRHFLEPLLAAHDRAAVELFAYAELPRPDAWSSRYRSLVDHWRPTHGLDDAALARCIRGDGIDILVDLAGHTAGNRLAAFLHKPAPVAASWLGYGTTTGLGAIDHFLTDACHVPPGSEALFAEQPWRLPCGWVYRPAAEMGPPGPAQLAQPDGLRLATMSRAARINRHTVRVWSALLHRLPRARLVVDSASYRDAGARAALLAAFSAEGIGPERLEIGHHSPPWDLLRSVHITLDCFPHNSGTTLFESLYMGVPFVTLAGRPGVGRIGSAILQAVGRAEWIAADEPGYIDTVCALASDPDRLASARGGLRAALSASPLMDEAGFARSVEQAFRAMLAR